MNPIGTGKNFYAYGADPSNGSSVDNVQLNLLFNLPLPTKPKVLLNTLTLALTSTSLTFVVAPTKAETLCVDKLNYVSTPYYYLLFLQTTSKATVPPQSSFNYLATCGFSVKCLKNTSYFG